MQNTIKNLITKAVTEIETERADREIPLSGNEFLEALFQKLFPEAPEVKKPRAKKAKTEPVVEGEAAPETPPKKPRAKKASADTPAAPEKKPRAKKEKGPENLAKLTPTQTKKFMELSVGSAVPADKKKFLEYVNGMTPEVYNAKKLQEHMEAFFPTAMVQEVEEDEECIEVEFNGKTYYVSPTDNKVYEEGDDGVHVFVGYAGMAAFEKMNVPAV